MSTVEDVVARIHATYARWSRTTPVEMMRADWDGLFPSPSSDIAQEPVELGMPGRWIAAPGATRDRVFVYLHGGGYRVGSSVSHGELVARLSAASGMAGLALDYPLVPEHRFPRAIEAMVAAWQALLASGTNPRHVAFVGDSAGGNLALASLVGFRRANLPLPACMALLSPWTDLAARGKSYESHAALDPLHTRAGLLATARSYLGEADPLDPLASPLDADMRGWPPLLVQVGAREVVRDDALSLAERARGAGCAVAYREWPDMIHVFQQFPELSATPAAIREIAVFLKEQLA